MRIPEYLSPSSLKCWEESPEEFFLRYLADDRPDRTPQTKPMSVGSAFDAYVKSDLYYKVFGRYDDFELDKLFESQVEPQNRDWARGAGDYCYRMYIKSGALADLAMELGGAIGEPIFETSVKNWIDEVPVLGKPDIFFQNALGVRVVYDWKVNGYCSVASPCKEYIVCRETVGSKRQYPHKNVQIVDFNGVKINVNSYFESVNSEWADQLSTYAILAGEEIGSENWIVGIDQLACDSKKFPDLEFPVIRVASHRARVSREWQLRLRDRYRSCWEAINSDWIFKNMSYEDSAARVTMLNEQASMRCTADGDSQDEWFNKVTR